MNALTVLLLVCICVAPALQASVQVLNLPYDADTGSGTCAHTCSGVGRYNNNFKAGWHDSGAFPGKVFRYVDISPCNFVVAPVVTVNSARGKAGTGRGICPALSVYYVSKGYFVVFSATDATASDMAYRTYCDVYWTASGFTCN